MASPQGVSGSGKSTVGAELARAMGDVPFVEGDKFHSQSNVEKMAAGTPLTDSDRMPWLKEVREHAQRLAKEQAQGSDGDDQKWKGVVVACSALKKSYRDYLRFGGDGMQQTGDSIGVGVRTGFVFIDSSGSEDLLRARMANRSGHFMKVDMLQSQLDTLEDPRNEEDVVVVALNACREDQVRQALGGLQAKMGQ